MPLTGISQKWGGDYKMINIQQKSFRSLGIGFYTMVGLWMVICGKLSVHDSVKQP